MTAEELKVKQLLHNKISELKDQVWEEIEVNEGIVDVYDLYYKIKILQQLLEEVDSQKLEKNNYDWCFFGYPNEEVEEFIEEETNDILDTKKNDFSHIMKGCDKNLTVHIHPTLESNYDKLAKEFHDKLWVNLKVCKGLK